MADFDQQERLQTSERIERVRQAVIKRGGSVTVGDIVTETGFSPDVAEDSLKSLISTHEGVMKVSEHGEILYAFTPNCISRDYRSWWERSRETIFKLFKGLCKILIMLVLVAYFIIYLTLIIALMCSNRNSRGINIDFGYMIWIFWGRGDSSRAREKKEPLYTRVYNFIFGPEKEKEDPMALQRDFAQLVRSKEGVITAEDWMVVSGHSLSECESEIARYTAIYDGEAQICSDGTLVYVFRDLMKSANRGQQTRMPTPAWDRLESKRPMTGNSSNVAVILLNVFNLIMAFIILAGGMSIINDPAYAYEFAADPNLLASYQSIITWLGTVPLIFSTLVFAGPLVRLPGNIKENRRRRRDNIRKVVLENVENARMGAIVNGSAAMRAVNHGLRRSELSEASVDEVNGVLDDMAAEMSAEPVNGGYRFNDLVTHSERAMQVRHELSLGKQDLGRVIFSTDSNDTEAQKNAEDVELETFDREMSRGHVQQSRYSDEASWSSPVSHRSRSSSSSRYGGQAY